MIVGNGCHDSETVELIHRFYQKTKIPVLTTMNAVDIMQGEDKLGFIGVYGNRVANIIVEYSDLVISIGARLGLRQIGNKKEYFAPNADLIRADIDQSELSRDIKPNEEKHLVDAKEFLINLLREEIEPYDEWNRACFQAKELLEPFDKNLGNLCIEKISSKLPENPIVAIDIGQAQCWSAQSLQLKGQAGRILIGGSYGSMGCGLPYAIGACVATGKREVFCITGDGGLQMNIQELQTVFSERLPIKVLVINNKALGKIMEIQVGSYENHMLITNEEGGYTVPDFEKVAVAYGIKAATITDYNDIDNYSEWFYDNDPCLVNIVLPEATVLLPKMNWNDREMKPLIMSEIMEKVQETLGA